MICTQHLLSSFKKRRLFCFLRDLVEHLIVISYIFSKCLHVPWNSYSYGHVWLWSAASVGLFEVMPVLLPRGSFFLFSVLTQMWNSAPISGSPPPPNPDVTISIRNCSHNWWNREIKEGSIHGMVPNSLEMAPTPWNQILGSRVLLMPSICLVVPCCFLSFSLLLASLHSKSQFIFPQRNLIISFVFLFSETDLYHHTGLFPLRESFTLVLPNKQHLAKSIAFILVLLRCEMRGLILDRGWCFPIVCLRACALSEEVKFQILTLAFWQWKRDLGFGGPGAILGVRCGVGGKGPAGHVLCSAESCSSPELGSWALLVNLSSFLTCVSKEAFTVFKMPFSKLYPVLLVFWIWNYALNCSLIALLLLYFSVIAKLSNFISF